MGSVTPFSIKISGSEGTPYMMALTPKASKPSIPAVGTGERYVTLPSLTPNYSDFANPELQATSIANIGHRHRRRMAFDR
jgi:hypothetical protein